MRYMYKSIVNTRLRRAWQVHATKSCPVHV